MLMWQGDARVEESEANELLAFFLYGKRQIRHHVASSFQNLDKLGGFN